MLRTLASADLLLKQVGTAASVRDASQARSIGILGVLSVAMYGACMGTFSLDSIQRSPLTLYSALKLPMLLAVSTGLCLPGFFVLNTALGLRADISRALQAILLAQACVALALGSMAPLILFAYASGITHERALVANCLLFALATGIGHISMWRRYQQLCADPERGPRHRFMLRAWVVMYAFVGTQMGWMLRPFVGNPDMPVAFFRQEPFSNAYIEVIRVFLTR